MEPQIETCPFCQKEAKRLTGFTASEDAQHGWWLECPTPNCLVAPMALTEDAAIQQWNLICLSVALFFATKVIQDELRPHASRLLICRSWNDTFRAELDRPNGGAVADFSLITALIGLGKQRRKAVS